MADPAGPLRFAVSRLHGGPQLESAARAFAALVGKQLGLAGHVHMAEDYPRLLDALLDGQADVAWLPPFTLARATQRGGGVAALCERRGHLLYRSALLVRVDSEVERVEQLLGARAAWTNPSSAAGYLVPRLHLRQRGLDPQELAIEIFHGSTSAACGAVFAGDADLATCYVTEEAATDPERARRELETALGPMMGSRLRVLDVTAPIPPDGVALSPTLTEGARSQLGAALLDLHRVHGGREALTALFQAERLAPATDEAMRMLAHLSAMVSGADDDVTMV